MSISYRPSGALPLAVAAIAAVTAIPAGAAVIAATGLNANIAANTSYTLDVNNDGLGDFTLTNSFSAGTAVVGGYHTGTKSVAPGTAIGAGPKYYVYNGDLDRSTNLMQVDSVIGDHQYLAFSFPIGAVNMYGWLDLSIHNPNLPGAASAAYEVTVHGYGYDNTGAAIAAGATGATGEVPEPSSLLLLAAGAAGFGALRRKSGQSAFTA